MSSQELNAATAPMVGKLVLTCALAENHRVEELDIHNSRPQQIGRILQGKKPEQALALVPKLFLLCSQAQQTAAYSAIASLSGQSLSQEKQQVLAGRCALEWLKEHCWQLWQMQRELFYPEFAMPESLKLSRLLLKQLQSLPALSTEQAPHPVASDVWPQISELLAPLLGMTPDSFLRMSHEELLKWSLKEAPYARMLATIFEHEAESVGHFKAWDLEQESGCLARQFNQPLVLHAYNLWGCGLATRLIARFVEICRVVAEPQITADNESGVAQASRGKLLHTIKLDDAEVITHYQIDAPTDRYFKADGMVGQALHRQYIPNSDIIWIRQLVWAIDPCVEFSVKIKES